ncbi:MAG: type II toxin-antitoxin system RelE/ParE family toxin [Chloroflexota bacterium]|nr:type II toxin-antitoxin system RelE/ParE family toxin [Chloroflexota bacterium]
MWEVEFTDQFEEWWDSLLDVQQDAIAAAVEILQDDGPSLGRPLVDTIKGSRHSNMKELRPGTTGNLRVLFAFDPLRHAILLIGGDKTGRWHEWYDEMLPVADDLYDAHLQALRDEGVL